METCWGNRGRSCGRLGAGDPQLWLHGQNVSETLATPWGCSSPVKPQNWGDIWGCTVFEKTWESEQVPSVNTHTLHPPESGHFPTPLRSKSLGECHSFPPPLSRSLIESREGKPHDPLFLPAKETAVNDKVTEQHCLVLAGQKAGGGSVYSLSLFTLQKCSPDDFLLHGNDWQVPLLWGFTSRGKRSKAFHRGAKTKVRRV